MKTNLKAKKGFNKIHVQKDLQFFFFDYVKIILDYNKIA